MHVAQPANRRATSSDLKRSNRKITRRRIIPLVIVILAGLTLLFIWQDRKSADLSSVQSVIAQVSRHYQLPSNETPALATVTDSAKVQSSLAGKVKDNDKILIYENHQKAIVYRPSTDRIVDVETVTVSKPNTTSSGTTSTAIPDIKPFGN